MTLEMKLAGVKKSRNWMAKTASGEKTFPLFSLTLHKNNFHLQIACVFVSSCIFS